MASDLSRGPAEDKDDRSTVIARRRIVDVARTFRLIAVVHWDVIKEAQLTTLLAEKAEFDTTQHLKAEAALRSYFASTQQPETVVCNYITRVNKLAWRGGGEGNGDRGHRFTYFCPSFNVTSPDGTITKVEWQRSPYLHWMITPGPDYQQAQPTEQEKIAIAYLDASDTYDGHSFKCYLDPEIDVRH